MLCVLCASVVIPHAKPAPGAGSGPEGTKQTVRQGKLVQFSRF